MSFLFSKGLIWGDSDEEVDLGVGEEGGWEVSQAWS